MSNSEAGPLISVGLGKIFSPLEKALFSTVLYGIGDIPSLHSLFHPFSRQVLAKAMQVLIREDILILLRPERRLALSPSIESVCATINQINSSHTELLYALTEHKEPGQYLLEDKSIQRQLLQALLGEDQMSPLAVKNLCLVVEVSQ